MTRVIADARRFADMHALYRFFDESGHLLYVGITCDLATRLAQHQVKRWYPLVQRITLEWLPHEAAARLAETRAIRTEHPRYNRAGVRPPKKAAAVKPAASPRQPHPSEILTVSEPAESRDLLADLDQVLEQERVRVSALPHLLRQLAPDYEPYRGLTGVRLRRLLDALGVRVVTKANVPRLNPADLRKVYRKAAA